MNQIGRRTLAIGLAVAVGATVVVLATTGVEEAVIPSDAERVATPNERPAAPRVAPPVDVEPPRVEPAPAPPERAADAKPAPKPAPKLRPKPNRARQQALEQARAAGARSGGSGSADDPMVPSSDIAGDADATDVGGSDPRTEQPVGGGLRRPAFGRGGQRTSGRSYATYGPLVVQGELDEAQVRRYVRRYAHRIDYCYVRRLLDVPSLAGTSTVKFRIAPTGQVESASSSGLEAMVDACIVDAFLSIQFPAFKAGTVDVLYTITFEDWAKPK